MMVMVDDLRVRDALDEASGRRTAARYAIEGLRMVAIHAGTWADPDRPPRDPAEVLRTIHTIAAESASRATAMEREEQERAGRR